MNIDGLEISGTIEPGWEPVATAFAANFTNATELGASACITHHGRPVVDIWAGDRAPDGTPWVDDTIVNVYSTTKTMTATCVLMCIDRGLLDPQATVATYWPEFAANGKENVTVAHCMSHQAGVPGWDPAIDASTLYDWDRCVEILAAMEPWFEPGTASAYHLVSQGYLLGELVRRVDGRSLGTFFREEVAEPLGADFHIGFGPEHDHRCGELVPPDMSSLAGSMGAVAADSVAARAFASCSIDATEPRTREWRAAEIGAAGGFGNARSVGRVHSALACGGTVDGVSLMSPETVESILEVQTDRTDLVMMTPLRHGLGFGLGTDAMPMPNERCFYWGGWGGSIAVIDLENELTATYVMNHMEADLLGDLRGGQVVLSAYGALMGGAGA
ncbi:MAG: serine hydrolase domain-containing protein [Acidimicrobiales bacterium]|nr:serine hydrolase domain-containing protein [Acidimicrobiales bacterium]